MPDLEYVNTRNVSMLVELDRLFDAGVRRYFVISKNPCSWCLSCRLWARGCGWREPVCHYVEQYSAFDGKWSELSSQEPARVLGIRYVDVLADGERLFGRI